MLPCLSMRGLLDEPILPRSFLRVKETLGCRGYLRYVDDFALFSNSKRQLRDWREGIVTRLAEHRLRLNSGRTHLMPCRTGHRFLGQIIYMSHRRLGRDNVRRFKMRLRHWEQAPPENVQERIASWLGHARQADTQALLGSVPSGGVNLLVPYGFTALL